MNCIYKLFRLSLLLLFGMAGGAGGSGGGSKRTHEFNGKKYSSESAANQARARHNEEQFKKWKDYHSK